MFHRVSQPRLQEVYTLPKPVASPPHCSRVFSSRNPFPVLEVLGQYLVLQYSVGFIYGLFYGVMSDCNQIGVKQTTKLLWQQSGLQGELALFFI